MSKEQLAVRQLQLSCRAWLTRWSAPLGCVGHPVTETSPESAVSEEAKGAPPGEQQA